jgi:hypothetical protein
MKDQIGPSVVGGAGSWWLYPLLLLLQTIGVILLYWEIVPLFRQLVGDPATHEVRTATRIWAMSAIVLIQAGYWARYQLHPTLPTFINSFVGHLVAFAGRLAFILATVVFSFVFISQKLASQLPLVGYALTLAGVFSSFCYMQELQNLGNALMGDRARPAAKLS